jgi:hypothetical protein
MRLIGSERLLINNQRSFDPTDIIGLTAWYQSSDRVKIVGSQVVNWGDMLGRYDLDLANTTFPGVRQNSGELNGALQIFSSGSSIGMKTSALIDRGPLTYFVAYRADAGARRILGWEAGSTEEGIWTRNSGGTPSKGVVSFRGGVESSKSTPVSFGISTTGKILCRRFNGTNASSQLIDNGVPVTLTNVVANDPGLGVEAKSIAIGATNIGYTEVICYGRSLTDEEVNLINVYLSKRYGVPVSLL